MQILRVWCGRDRRFGIDNQPRGRGLRSVRRHGAAVDVAELAVIHDDQRNKGQCHAEKIE